jgi:hypothetical protein
VAALVAIFPIIAALQLLGAEIPHVVQMAIWSIAWGLLALIAVLLAGRLAFGRWLRVGPVSVVAAATGVALSAIVHATLEQWQIGRFGIIDPDMVGWTAGLFAVLIGQATAIFGSLVAPVGARALPVAAMLIGAVIGVGVVVSNATGLGDGMRPESWPLAISIGASAMYFVGSATLGLTRLLKG